MLSVGNSRISVDGQKMAKWNDGSGPALGMGGVGHRDLPGDRHPSRSFPRGEYRGSGACLRIEAT
ncbi:MAG: hypothetical protein DWI22_03060 [Planctomycetota bacterium]|nr:MAG: hypothetical protein DWI22_03060 [Planctomycetota bacterium]